MRRWPRLALVVVAACTEAPRLPPSAQTDIVGTATATTSRWAPVMTARADWRTVGDDRLLVKSQPLLRFRDPRKPTVFAFWATYCPPCFTELPLLKRLHREGQVAVVSVSLDVEQTSLAATALGHHQVAHKSVVLTKDSLRPVGDRLPEGLPFALIVDDKGQVVAAHSGLLDQRALTPVLSAGH